MNTKDKISPHFQLGEFLSPKDRFAWDYLRQNQTKFMPRLRKIAGVLEQIRAHFKTAVIITSGLRSPTYNKAIGGALFSRHKEGDAADIYLMGADLATVAEFAKTLPEVGGVAVGPGFIHVDCRPRVFGRVTTWRY